MRHLISKAAGASAALLLAASASGAQAATWLLQYAAWSGAPAAASLTLTVDDQMNALGGFNITAVSGQVDGDTILALTANPNQPQASYSADGLFIFDNVLTTSGGVPWLSNPGILFTSASGFEYNLFSDSPTQYELYKAAPGQGYVANSVGMVTAEAIIPRGLGPLGEGGFAVPEPASWALMIMGVGGVGAVLRGKRRRAVALA